jgi:hypothetical protein
MFTEFWWENLRERGHWGEQVAEEGVTLKRNFRKLEGFVGTGWIWLRIGRGGGHL